MHMPNRRGVVHVSERAPFGPFRATARTMAIIRVRGRTMAEPEGTIDPYALLLSADAVRAALGTGIVVEPGEASARARELGSVLGAAAVGAAFRSFSGAAVSDEASVPFKVGLMALVFAAEGVARRTFDEVAGVAHLRTALDGVDVAVETVTAPNGLVSYWAYLSTGSVLAIATLDSLDPARISMSEFRTLVGCLGERLRQAMPA